MRGTIFALGLVAGSLIGCDQEYDPDAPAIDPNAPLVHITSPTRGTFAGDVGTVTVTGTATDNESVESVTINGIPATLLADGTFIAQVPVTAGTNLLHAIAKDTQGNQGKETRAVAAGPMEPISQMVPSSITASMTAQTFDAIGRGITGYMTTGNLTAAAQPMNPVVNYGAPNGPDCLYAQARITSVTVGSTSKITLAPQRGGIYLEADLVSPNVNMGLAWAVSCFDGSRNVSVGASRIKITGVLKLGVNGDKFEIHLDDEDVRITGFNVELGGVPGDVINYLSLDTAIGPILALMVERFAVPYVNRSLAALNATKTVDVLGTMVDIKVRPARIDVDIPGAVIELDTQFRAHGDTVSPGFVYVTNQVPVMDMNRGFELAMADDGMNQLLGSFWAAKGMEGGFDLKTGSYGEVGVLYDRAEIQAKLPPFVDASGEKLVLTVGDMLVTFKDGAKIATQIAINGEVEISVVPDATGALRLDVGTPTIYVDVLDENVDGANQLSNAQFEAVSSFALSRIIAFGSGALGAVPLPAFGGVAVQNVGVTEEHGYLVVGGDIQ